MMFLGNPKPKSSAKLQQRIQRAMDGLPPVRQKILHQNIHNTILLQFLEGLGVAKGGGALSLRMPLPKGRVSRDFDTSMKTGAEEFERELSSRLQQGWEGFTGDLIDDSDKRDKDGGMSMGMRPYTVRLRYLGKPFCTLQLEATPDISGFNSHAKTMEPDVAALDVLEKLGFNPVASETLDPRDQLADKIHAITDPEKNRGRDLSDIRLLIEELTPVDLKDLRERVRHVEQAEGRHSVHMLSGNKYESMRKPFDRSLTPFDFDECWRLSQAVIEQVDERHRDMWEPVFTTGMIRDAITRPMREVIPPPFELPEDEKRPRLGQSREPKGLPQHVAGTFRKRK
ncbi:nucleotidyl transferase AbiEii/AbiGii toxin family protein [Bifidobacterium breve]|uniref:nucleotidyl transferase AbiEii/AbiGii toxin family protein n=1 Tax=Bifidobacterium breve TaxID=1685 RepID=UPI002164B5F6|nr:nucleotidyl transferase AbiEii/AbiGii toxin family protein [Bifidobacterium breve]